MSDERESTYLLDIYLEARLIVEFMQEIESPIALQNDQLVNRAVVRSFEVIGEAVKRLSPEFQATHPTIDWRGYARMRDRLIHQYNRVDWRIVWEVVQNELPDLISLLKAIVPADQETLATDNDQSQPKE